MAASGQAVLDLYGDFIELRRSGTNRDKAWFDILQRADPLSEKQVQRLLALAKNWELNEGFQYYIRTEDDPRTTSINDNESVIRPIAPRPAASEKKNSPLDTQRLAPIDTDPRLDPAYFSDESWFSLYFPDNQEPIGLHIPRGKEVIIGRAAPNAAMSPDIDLAALWDVDLGISRLHATLQQQDHTVVITDLGSLNHTLVNGERLHPHERRVLQSGDEVRFGKLKTHVHFQH